MPRPVTEIVIVALQPGTNPEENMGTLIEIISKQQGCLSIWWGRWKEDEDKVQMAINWTDITAHEAFQQSGADYEQLFALLKPVLAGPPIIYHVYLDQETIDRILADPVVGLATFYGVKDGFEAAVDNTLAVGAQSEGCLRYTRGEIVEEISQGADDAKAKGHFAAVGWTSLEARMAAAEREEVKASGAATFGTIGGYEIHHVAFQKAWP